MYGKWSDLAFACRYGHQDLFKMLGREHITALEMRLFTMCVSEHFAAEVTPRNEIGLPPSND